MMCCGKNVKTPFCPNCGKSNCCDSGIAGLLDHLYWHVRTHKKRIERRGSFANQNARAAKLDAADKRLLQKWQSWADALEALIAKGEACQ